MSHEQKVARCEYCGFPDEDGTCGCHPEPEPDHDDSVRFCPNCERPNQFGELCAACERDEQEAIAAGERWADEREGNGYPMGTIGAETR